MVKGFHCVISSLHQLSVGLDRSFCNAHVVQGDISGGFQLSVKAVLDSLTLAVSVLFPLDFGARTCNFEETSARASTRPKQKQTLTVCLPVGS